MKEMLTDMLQSLPFFACDRCSYCHEMHTFGRNFLRPAFDPYFGMANSVIWVSLFIYLEVKQSMFLDLEAKRF